MTSHHDIALIVIQQLPKARALLLDIEMSGREKEGMRKKAVE